MTITTPAKPTLPPKHHSKFLDPEATANKDLRIHRWTGWIAGFSGSFAQGAIRQYLPSPRPDCLILDPFAGVGTTLLEAQRAGIDSVGFDINPYACLVARVKLAAPELRLSAVCRMIGDYQQFVSGDNAAPQNFTNGHARKPAGFRSRIPFYSPAVEEQVLVTLEFAETLVKPLKDLFKVAFASVMVEFSNYTYEPSLSSRPGAGKPLIQSAPVVEILLAKLHQMASDIEAAKRELRRVRKARWAVQNTSFFEEEQFLAPRSVDFVVTSPPYLNNYHYVRNTRPQLFWTTLVSDTKELTEFEERNFGKFWQTVRGRGPIPLEFTHPEVEQQIVALRRHNTHTGVYGGSGWANYVTAYMNDLNRLCAHLLRVLRPGGVAVVVVGNSVIQGQEVRVAQALADIGGQHGLVADSVEELRSRVGSSIVDTGARVPGQQKRGLFDYAVILRQPA